MKWLALAAIIGLAGCMNGQASIDVSTDKVATFPGVPASVAALAPRGQLTAEGVLSVDVSRELRSVSEYGSIRTEITKNAIGGDALAYLTHVKATALSEDGLMPPQVVADLDIPPNSTEVELTSKDENTALIAYLLHGKVQIRLQVTGELPEESIALTHVLIAHVALTVDGAIKL